MAKIVSEVIEMIRCELRSTFGEIDLWFLKDKDLHSFRPANGGWSVNEILEHVTLTSHFLLIIIDKASSKAIRNINGLNLNDELIKYDFNNDALNEISIHQSFNWIRPPHMEPTGVQQLDEIREIMKSHLTRCLQHLEVLKNGEGVLYKTTMTVNGLGKIDVYQYIYFLALHAKRHITQMKKNESEYKLKYVK